MRIASYVIPAVVLSISAASGADTLPGVFLEEAKKTDLFTFFHLKQNATDTDAQKHTVVTFNPDAAKFSKLVTVKVMLDAEQKIRGMELYLARSFVDDNTNGVFAADIAKSVLRAMLPDADLKKTGDLINEIEYGRMAKGTIVNGNVKTPKLPDLPTDGYKTYLGLRPSFEQELDKAKLELKAAKTEKDGDTLLIAVREK